jgi:hypothetical protein
MTSRRNILVELAVIEGNVLFQNERKLTNSFTDFLCRLLDLSETVQISVKGMYSFRCD